MASLNSYLKQRGRTYYLHYFENGVRQRLSLGTEDVQVAKEKQRVFDSARVRGEDNPLPTQTPLPKAVATYIDYMRARKTKHGVDADLSYLRRIFGPICPALENGHRCTKRLRIDVDARKREPFLRADHLEQITPAHISAFITERVARYRLAPKTANRHREVLQRLFNWAMQEYGVRMPGGRNPAALVQRYRERAPRIRFLTREQIERQLAALEERPLLQAMVAVYIYAGLRREEALWLTLEDVDLTAGIHGVLRIRAKEVNGEAWEPKTKVNRIVPISKVLRGYLDRYRRPDSVSPWYFPSLKGCRWDPDNLSAWLRDFNQSKDLVWTCLDYRHSFGSHLAMKGESLYKISALMGNSPEICRRHYATLLPESLLQSVEFDAEETNTPPPATAPAADRPRLRLIASDGKRIAE
ncbi:MAG: tyrosine-type recombinase/integrase [Candidatus Hydrogenedentes bacterium]|nr:tyrosine-type recombinase/integrase [Candidatus Hydrogenedentota bacterium]